MKPGSVALHEAGHAAVARHFGVGVKAIFADEDRRTGWCQTLPAYWSPQASGIFHLAGWRAQLRVYPDVQLHGDDLEQVKHLATAERERLIEITDGLLTRYWPVILELAGKITERSRLYADELQELGYGGPPLTRRF